MPDETMTRPAGKMLLAMFDDVDLTGLPQVRTVLAGLPSRMFRVTVQRVERCEHVALTEHTDDA